jgi:hypothetical protein
MSLVRVQGEVYDSAEEALRAAAELEARMDDLPEYGPRRRQLRAHVEELREAASKAQDAEIQRARARAAGDRRRQPARNVGPVRRKPRQPRPRVSAERKYQNPPRRLPATLTRRATLGRRWRGWLLALVAFCLICLIWTTLLVYLAVVGAAWFGLKRWRVRARREHR